MNSVKAPVRGKTERVTFRNKEVYPLTPPKLYQEVDADYQYAETMTSNAIVLSGVDDALVWFDGIQTVIKDADDNVVLHQGNLNKAFIPDAETQKLSGVSVLLATPASSCYYHWLVEVVPKIKAIIDSGISFDDVDHILMWEQDRPFQIKTFEALGFPVEKIKIISNTPQLQCDYVYHVEIKNYVGMAMQKYIPETIKSIFLEDQQLEQNRKLYISRGPGARRKTANEDEVIQLVKEYGYEVIRLEGRTMTFQAELFNSASSIIAAHGAALANLVYCQPGAHVVELFGAHAMSFYYGLANLCELDYSAILRSGDQRNQVVDPNVCNTLEDRNETIREDSIVNIDALRAALEANKASESRAA